MLRTCTICKKEKDLELFVKDKRKQNGRRNQCKECVNARMRKYIKTYHQKESYKEYQKKYMALEVNKRRRCENVKRYMKTGRGKEYKKAYQRSEKYKAYCREMKKGERYKNWEKEYLKKEEVAYKVRCRKKLNSAIASGKIKKRDICEICYKPETQCHHDNYDKPFDFVELCITCHTKLHQVT